MLCSSSCIEGKQDLKQWLPLEAILPKFFNILLIAFSSLLHQLQNMRYVVQSKHWQHRYWWEVIYHVQWQFLMISVPLQLHVFVHIIMHSSSNSDSKSFGWSSWLKPLENAAPLSTDVHSCSWARCKGDKARSCRSSKIWSTSCKQWWFYLIKSLTLQNQQENDVPHKTHGM